MVHRQIPSPDSADRADLKLAPTGEVERRERMGFEVHRIHRTWRAMTLGERWRLSVLATQPPFSSLGPFAH